MENSWVTKHSEFEKPNINKWTTSLGKKQLKLKTKLSAEIPFWKVKMNELPDKLIFSKFKN